LKIIAVHTTVASLEEARLIAKTLVERKLVACAQISAIESFYTWKGGVQNDQEFRLLLKTTDAQYKAVEAAVLDLHSYELPAIYAVALEHVYEPYAAWVEECSAGE
jgi:periplasmic divalent cation tolerance protein